MASNNGAVSAAPACYQHPQRAAAAACLSCQKPMCGLCDTGGFCKACARERQLPEVTIEGPVLRQAAAAGFGASCLAWIFIPLGYRLAFALLAAPNLLLLLLLAVMFALLLVTIPLGIGFVVSEVMGAVTGGDSNWKLWVLAGVNIFAGMAATQVAAALMDPDGTRQLLGDLAVGGVGSIVAAWYATRRLRSEDLFKVRVL